MRRLRRDDEAGTVAVLFAVLATLFLTLVSLVVDVGRLFDERAQLGRGAEAAALAVAGECARMPDGCAGPNLALAQQYANENARDGQSALERVDLSGDADRGTVTVRTRSLSAGGGDLPLSLRRDGVETATVRAAAAATWGPVRGATTRPLAISLCDWERARAEQGGHLAGSAPSGGGTVVVPYDPNPASPGGGPPPPPPTCTAGGATVPVGFVSLAGGSGCAVTSEWDARWLSFEEGASSGSLGGCLEEGTVVPVVVFDAACAPGRGGCRGGPGGHAVRIAGYAAFVVTGWRFPGEASPHAPACPSEQPPPARCISGVVTRLVLAGVPVSPPGSGPAALGVTAIQLAPPPRP